jgi:molybdate transport system substrate-binding protein
LDLSKGLEALKDSSIQHIAIANPAHAPYGRAAEAALRSAGVYEAVQSKLVLGDNIVQTAQFVQTGAADVGLIALSLAVAPTMASAGRYFEIPQSMYPTLEQGGCVLKNAQDSEAAKTLTGYMQAESGRAVLKKYGFSLPESK